MITFRLLEQDAETVLFTSDTEEIMVPKNRIIETMIRLTATYRDYEVRFMVD